MPDWPFPWECGKLQWRTQLAGRGLLEVKAELEDYLDKIHSQEQAENSGSHFGPTNSSFSSESPAVLQEKIECAEKDLRLVEKWMNFCK